MMKEALMLGVLGAMVCASAFAEETTIALRDVTTVQDGRGSARVLFRTGALPASGGVLIESAVLRIPYTGAVAERAVELRVCPVTEAWQGGGRWDTGFDEELYSRGTLDLRRGSGVMSFDVTVALREIRENGFSADGFVLTATSETSGVLVGDLSRLGDFSGASLLVKTSVLPSGRPSAAWLARHRG